jgi:hypothetical protein
MKILLPAFVFVFSSLLFSSCGNDGEDKTADSVLKTDSVLPDLDSMLKADSTVTASYRMSKEDSARVADSVAKTKNPIRDFN